MFNTFERDMLANERHQDLLRSFAQRQLADEATRTGQTTGLLTILFGGKRSTTVAQPSTPATVARAA